MLRKTGIVMLVLLLTGCGVTTTTAVSSVDNGGPVQGQATGTPGATSAAATVIASTTGASSATTGCPQATQTVQWPTPPTVIITSAQTSKGAKVSVGQTLEVALAFGHKWTLGPAAGQPALTLNSPAGYGDASLQSCIWHFTGAQAGQFTLQFISAPNCPAHKECPKTIGTLAISIEVDPAQ